MGLHGHAAHAQLLLPARPGPVPARPGDLAVRVPGCSDVLVGCPGVVLERGSGELLHLGSGDDHVGLSVRTDHTARLGGTNSRSGRRMRSAMQSSSVFRAQIKFRRKSAGLLSSPNVLKGVSLSRCLWTRRRTNTTWVPAFAGARKNINAT